jgi:hypothetical protein
MADKITATHEIKIFGFGPDSSTMNKGPLSKKLGTVEDILYFLKVVTGIIDEKLSRYRNSMPIGRYDALFVLNRKIKEALVEAYNNKDNTL